MIVTGAAQRHRPGPFEGRSSKAAETANTFMVDVDTAGTWLAPPTRRAASSVTACLTDVSDEHGGCGPPRSQTAIDQTGRLDVVINNAGLLRDKVLWKIEDADWDLVVDVLGRSASRVPAVEALPARGDPDASST